MSTAILQNRYFSHDRCIRLIWLASIVISVAAICYFYSTNQVLSDYDSIARLNIARRIIDSLSPGIGQIGGIWLPLPQILFVPFIWSDTLWHTGFAGVLVSSIAFIVAAVYIYKLVYLISNKDSAASIAWLVYVSNINILILQSSPMSESFFLMTVVLSLYFLIRWIALQQLTDMIYSAFFIALCTLTRYEGYFYLFGLIMSLLLVLYLIIGRRPQEKEHKSGLFFLFLTMACFGILLWMLYSALIFHDPFNWLKLYSGTKGQLDAAGATPSMVVQDYPRSISFLSSAKIYSRALSLMSGLSLVISSIGILFYATAKVIHSIRKKYTPEYVLIPIVVIVIIVYGLLVVGYYRGFIPKIEAPQITWQSLFDKSLNTSSFSNIRYGLVLFPLIAILFGYMASRSRFAARTMLLIVLFHVTTTFSTPLFLQFRLDKVWKNEAISSAAWMKEHYDGGLILVSANRHENFMFQTGLPYASFIYEGVQKEWKESMIEPSKHATWIVFTPDIQGDLVHESLHDIASLDAVYNKKYDTGGYRIYKIKDPS